jgi:hypothetical protein
MDHLPAIAGPIGVAAITPGPNNLLPWAALDAWLARWLAGRCSVVVSTSSWARC